MKFIVILHPSLKNVTVKSIFYFALTCKSFLTILPPYTKTSAMQKKSGSIPFTFIISEIIGLIIIGILSFAAYGFPLKLNRMAFFIFSFGASAVLLFNVLRYNNFKAFLITQLLLTIFITAFVFKNPTFLSIIHHVGWTFGLGAVIFVMKQVFPKSNTSAGRIMGFITWVIAMTLFFYLVFLVNGLNLKYRHDKTAIDLSTALIRALKFGPMIGGGIGLGHIFASLLLKR